MNPFTLLFLQLTAHFAADFLFQSERMCSRKATRSISMSHVYHALIVVALAWLCSLDYHFWPAALLIGAIHFAVDCLKSRYVLLHPDRQASAFFADQAVHLLLLSIITRGYSLYFTANPVTGMLPSPHHTAVVLAFVCCAKPANIVIRRVFELCKLTLPKGDANQPAAEKELENAGKVIGIMERFMTLALILAGQFSAVGLIIAAKSILRFNSPQKNEYILVGTLLSFGIAILLGLALRLHLSV